MLQSLAFGLAFLAVVQNVQIVVVAAVRSVVVVGSRGVGPACLLSGFAWGPESSVPVSVKFVGLPESRKMF